jgi:hypothetical protein
MNGVPATNWAYGLGWYMRGNWVAWSGGSSGSRATALHNSAYNFTVVHLTNTIGNGLTEFANPLMTLSNGTSPMGQAFPCMNTVPGECAIGSAY